MGFVLRYIRFKAFSRAFRGYHTGWFVVGAAVWMIQRVRRRQDVVFRTLLQPGERLVIRAPGPASLHSPDD